MSVPQALFALCLILGASQFVSEAVFQNPEFPSLLFEPNLRRHTFDAFVIEREGRLLLTASSSYSHSLDRIRFLRQKWTFLVTLHDLLGWTAPREIWRAISAIADAVLKLTYEVAWEYHARMRKLEGDCPVLVVAFGKLGGDELNYSSDVDLAFVHRNGLSEKSEAEARRFCEAFVNALTQKMGRGSLYRVDLRLRPYGSAGEITRSMRGYEAYYELYAEPWETQALMRARAIVGPEELATSWEHLRIDRCFRPSVTEFTIQQVLSMREKIDAFAKPEDFKRGPGGIRDVEFIVQAMQLIHGFEVPELRTRNTLVVLDIAVDKGLIPPETGESLAKAYVWLRQLEHRCQLSGDQQTHVLPTDAEELDSVARLMGLWDGVAVSNALGDLREKVRATYSHWFSGPTVERPRELNLTIQELGIASIWLEELLGVEGTDQVLFENRDTGPRIAQIIRQGPLLLPAFRRSASLTEALISGEILELGLEGLSIREAWVAREDAVGARKLSNAHTAIWTRFLLGDPGDVGMDPWESSSALVDLVIREVASTAPVGLSIIGLGSYANFELGPSSDADLVVLVERAEDQAIAEAFVSDSLARLHKWHTLGAPTELDLRLRPEGSKGLLVRTFEGFANYMATDMELWERFALGHCRLIYGPSGALDLVLEAARPKGFSRIEIEELLAIKARIENERVSRENVTLNVKLGAGGLNDIEWLIRLEEMKLGFAGAAKTALRLEALLDRFALNEQESVFLEEAHRYLIELRAKMALLGIQDDLLPSSEPFRNVLSVGFGSVNNWLSHHETVRQEVRRVYNSRIHQLFDGDFR